MKIEKGEEGINESIFEIYGNFSCNFIDSVLYTPNDKGKDRSIYSILVFS
jgi:hypothetical protein